MILISHLLAIAGCATSTPTADRRPTSAAALAYAPPVLDRLGDNGVAELDAVLARHHRGPSAVLGYDTPKVTHYYLSVDDTQGAFGTAGGFGYGGFGYGGLGGHGAFIPGHGYLGGPGLGGYGGGFYDSYTRRASWETTYTRVRP